MNSWLAKFVVHCVAVIGVSVLMLVPTGMCICDEHHDDSSTEQHEPGCPKVRKIDRSAAPLTYVADNTATGAIAIVNETSPQGPIDLVVAVAHGPPRGRPLYLSLHILLI